MNRLDFVFGSDSHGETPLDRARSSSRVFVRSQVQLALASDRATGRRLSATEALLAFGIDALEEVIDRGATLLVEKPSEPAATFHRRRQRLKLSYKSLAEAAGVMIDEVRGAEIPGRVTPIHALERIAQELALDERRIGKTALDAVEPDLATGLRELNSDGMRNDQLITALAEAAWIVRRETELTTLLGIDTGLCKRFPGKDGNYQYPSYEHGYALAARTRVILNLSPDQPILNLRHLVTDVMQVPLVETGLGDDVAGATIVSGPARGIALATKYDLPMARRMTLAHELGHFLWDPTEKLKSIRVESTAAMTGRIKDIDPVEIRANAFAIAFLAPPNAVNSIWEAHLHPRDAIAALSVDYGIHPTAAAWHLTNLRKLDYAALTYSRAVPRAVDALWAKREVTSFPGGNLVRSSRGGRFTQLTLLALRHKLITDDTARSWLRIDAATLAQLDADQAGIA